LELCAWSTLPVGSGLGGSSIVAASAVAAVAKTLGLPDVSSLKIVEWVLKVEQLLSSGGGGFFFGGCSWSFEEKNLRFGRTCVCVGWQDQIGGIFAGAKICL